MTQSTSPFHSPLQAANAATRHRLRLLQFASGFCTAGSGTAATLEAVLTTYRAFRQTVSGGPEPAGLLFEDGLALLEIAVTAAHAELPGQPWEAVLQQSAAHYRRLAEEMVETAG